jgi:glucose/arabinose dehydrogenase
MIRSTQIALLAALSSTGLACGSSTDGEEANANNGATTTEPAASATNASATGGAQSTGTKPRASESSSGASGGSANSGSSNNPRVGTGGTSAAAPSSSGSAGGPLPAAGGDAPTAPTTPTMTMASGCSAPTANPMAGNPCPGTPPPALKITEIASGFVSPTHVMQAPGDDTRFYVLEQRGTVRVVKDGALAPEPLIDLRDLDGAPVNNSTILPSYGEGGLLGGAFDPRFSETKRMWLSYTKPGPGFTVVQFTLDNPDAVDVTKFKELLSYEQFGFIPGQEATNHVGSHVAFGPDGCMYISRGDGGGENDRQMSGQKTSDDLCSILRIDVDKYPEAAPGNLEGHVWNFGFRNPWRYSFDREKGDLYIGDVGQDVGTGFEEINVEPRGAMGRNYGWSVAQGSTTCEGDCAKMSKPALEYGITDTQNSVIGGYVYRGKKIPELVGRYVWADWTERKIKTFVYKGDNNGQAEICDAADTAITVPTKVRSFGEGNDGEIYIVAGGAPSAGLTSAGLMEAGTLYRIDPM